MGAGEGLDDQGLVGTVRPHEFLAQKILQRGFHGQRPGGEFHPRFGVLDGQDPARKGGFLPGDGFLEVLENLVPHFFEGQMRLRPQEFGFVDGQQDAVERFSHGQFVAGEPRVLVPAQLALLEPDAVQNVLEFAEGGLGRPGFALRAVQSFDLEDEVLHLPVEFAGAEQPVVKTLDQALDFGDGALFVDLGMERNVVHLFQRLVIVVGVGEEAGRQADPERIEHHVAQVAQFLRGAQPVVDVGVLFDFREFLDGLPQFDKFGKLFEGKFMGFPAAGRGGFLSLGQKVFGFLLQAEVHGFQNDLVVGQRHGAFDVFVDGVEPRTGDQDGRETVDADVGHAFQKIDGAVVEKGIFRPLPPVFLVTQVRKVLVDAFQGLAQGFLGFVEMVEAVPQSKPASQEDHGQQDLGRRYGAVEGEKLFSHRPGQRVFGENLFLEKMRQERRLFMGGLRRSHPERGKRSDQVRLRFFMHQRRAGRTQGRHVVAGRGFRGNAGQGGGLPFFLFLNAVAAEINAAEEKGLVIDALPEKVVQVNPQRLHDGLQFRGEKEESVGVPCLDAVGQQFNLSLVKVLEQARERFVHPFGGISRFQGEVAGPAEQVVAVFRRDLVGEAFEPADFVALGDQDIDREENSRFFLQFP